MASEFFQNFPVINYDGIELRNLMLKSRMIKEIIERNELFHPLTVEDGERPDTIAYDYYGNSELYWIVLMSNDMVDPYYDWPMTQAEFKAYIMKKYGSVQAAMQEVIYWSNPDFDYFMTPESKTLLDVSDLTGWAVPIYAYDYENELNEKKREIRLIDAGLVPQVLQEIAHIYG